MIRIAAAAMLLLGVRVGPVLEIAARPDPMQPPSLIASSPCFPQSRRDSDVRKLPVIRQTQ